MLKCLREAVREEGLQGPFAQQLLETISFDLNTPTDWKQLARAIFTSGQHLGWLAVYKDECEQALRNQQANVPLDYDCLVGDRQYSSPVVQAMGPPHYFDQVRLAATRAFNCCKVGPTPHPNKLLQGPNEDFASFVSQVVESCKRKVQHMRAAKALAKELIFGGAAPICQTLIAPIRHEELDRWILACREVNAQGAHALAAALAAHLQPPRRPYLYVLIANHQDILLNNTQKRGALNPSPLQCAPNVNVVITGQKTAVLRLIEKATL